MVQIEQKEKYLVLVGNPVGLLKVYQTNAKLKVYLLKTFAFLTREKCRVFTKQEKTAKQSAIG